MQSITHADLYTLLSLEAWKYYYLRENVQLWFLTKYAIHAVSTCFHNFYCLSLV